MSDSSLTSVGASGFFHPHPFASMPRRWRIVVTKPIDRTGHGIDARDQTGAPVERRLAAAVRVRETLAEAV